jgi:imidazolonepropionase-like amidohydrolase
MTHRHPASTGAVAAWGASLALLLAACTPTNATKRPDKPDTDPVAAGAGAAKAAPFPSTYRAPAGEPVLISGATVLTGTGERLDGADVLLRDGKVAAVGRGIAAAPGTRVIDGRGKWVTPGIIDIHSHLGVYPSPGVDAHSDGNEATAPNTANVWAEHSVWPQDPGFEAALEGGVTTLHVLPGSANLFGGRSVTLKNVPAVTYQAMKFPDAPHGLKMACGENPKRVYGNRRTLPSTRMGNVASWRQSWSEAVEYRRDWAQYEARRSSGAKDLRAPKRDLRMETLAAVLQGEVLVQNHCYRADEMAIVLDMAKEFGYKVSTFHHATEAYKIADLLAEHGTCAAVWADWWGFKMESYDAIPENMVIVDAARGGCAIVHSDSDEGIQRLNQEAAKGIASAARVGITIAPEHAIRWLTQNPARALGIADKTGTLEVGKAADVVVWNGTPFSSYALTEQVFIDGARRFDRGARRALPESDFMLGQPAAPGVSP